MSIQCRLVKATVFKNQQGATFCTNDIKGVNQIPMGCDIFDHS